MIVPPRHLSTRATSRRRQHPWTSRTPVHKPHYVRFHRSGRRPSAHPERTWRWIGGNGFAESDKECGPPASAAPTGLLRKTQSKGWWHTAVISRRGTNSGPAYSGSIAAAVLLRERHLRAYDTGCKPPPGRKRRSLRCYPATITGLTYSRGQK